MSVNRNRIAPFLAAVLAAAALAPPLAAQAPSAQGAGGKSTDPKAAALVNAFEGKLNLGGIDITNTFTLVQKKEGETDHPCEGTRGVLTLR